MSTVFLLALRRTWPAALLVVLMGCETRSCPDARRGERVPLGWGYWYWERVPSACCVDDLDVAYTTLPRDFVSPDEPVRFVAPCVISGCRGEICGGAIAVSDCEPSHSDACFLTHGLCAPQADGRCAWDRTDELDACLASPPPLRSRHLCDALVPRWREP